jgi:phosphonoacetaldehyde hydrolase
MIKAVIFDWAGTVVDFGCMAPTLVFIDVFRQKGISLTIEEVRGPMGMAKMDHVRKLLEIDRVREEWMGLHNRYPDENDVAKLYRQLEPALVKIVGEYADVIPGVKEVIEELREQGILIGSTTGYVGSMMEQVAAVAGRQGFTPDCIVCSDEVPEGRPAPWGCFLNAQKMNIWPMSEMVKIGDTVADIREGLNAGMWTIGCTLSGNEVGLTEEEVDKLDPEVRFRKVRSAEEKLLSAGAHYVIDGVWECLPVLDTISSRIASGERP